MNQINENYHILLTRIEFWIIVAVLATLAMVIGYDIAIHGSRFAVQMVKYFNKMNCD